MGRGIDSSSVGNKGRNGMLIIGEVVSVLELAMRQFRESKNMR